MDHSKPSLVHIGKGSQGDRSSDREQRPRSTSNDATASKVHTLTACVRCRTRKTRCDPGLPRCGPCERSNALCEYFDTSKGKRIPRTYVTHLQSRVQALEEELDLLSKEQYASPDAEHMARGAGYVRFKENEDSRYLGPSSGIAISRLVMELAKQNTNSKSIKEIVPDTKAQQIKDRFSKEEEKPTSKVYPLISDVAAPDLPTRGLTDSLVENFNRKAQYMLPTLHEPSFDNVVEDVYNGSGDPYKNFALRMVIAISMQKLDTQYAGLADSYYLAALPFLEQAVKPKDLGTLQCFALIAQYSLLTPTRTAAYWVVGLAARLCQELGITEEYNFAPVSDYRSQYNAIEIDMRRRLFWIITSMEFGLSHSLGRPSAFGTTFDHINVGFFETVDDRFITPSGVLPGSPLSMKKWIAVHFFRMRLLQAEIRRKLYLKKRPKPKTDQDPWFLEMERKLNDWRYSSPKNDEGSGLSETWFTGRYNTMIVFLYRPSPQVPVPSVKAARRCFDASIFNIDMQSNQIASKSVDLTWIFTQSLFMALNTVLWAISYPEIRRENPRQDLEKNINVAQQAMYLASKRWPGVESALELYQNLIMACLKSYDGGSETSYVIDSVSNQTSPASSQDTTTPPLLPSPMAPQISPHQDQNAPRSSPAGYFANHDNLRGKPRASPTPSDYSIADSTRSGTFSVSDSTLSGSYQDTLPQQPSMTPIDAYQDSHFDQASMYNQSPQSLPAFQCYPSPQQKYSQYLGSIGDQYSQYLHAPYIPQQPLKVLNQEQQLELMRNLEDNGLDWG